METVKKHPIGVSLALQTACQAHPDERVMQVIVNAVGSDPFYVEDDQAMVLLYNYAKNV